MNDFQLTANSDVAKITLTQAPDKPGIGAQIFGSLWSHGLNVQLIVSSASTEGKVNITFAISKNDLDHAIVELKSIKEEIGAQGLDIDPDVALLTISHPQLAQTPGVGNKIFGSLSKVSVNVDAVSSSANSMTCMIRTCELPKAMETLKQAFGLSKA